MLMFRYCLIGAFVLMVCWWPINYFISYLLHKRRIMKVVKSMRSVDDYPLVGIGLRFLGKNNEGIMEELRKLVSSTPTPFITWLGPKSFLMVDHPDEIQVIMNSKSCGDKSYIYRFFNGGSALFAAPGHIWKKPRKQLSMMFNSQMTGSFLPTFNKMANLCTENIGRNIGKGPFDVMQYSSTCALDIVCESLLGMEMNIQSGENIDYMEALEKWLSSISRRMLNVFLHPDFIYKNTAFYQAECHWLERSKELQNKVIAQKLLEFKETDSLTNDDTEDGFLKPLNFIEQMVKSRLQGAITDEQILDLCFVMVFAGHDTSAIAIANTIMMLAMHSNVEQRVMDELNQVFNDQPIEADITMEQVNQLVYLEQVIKETLRLYPVAAFIPRYCSEDLQFPNYTIPAGTEIVVSVMTAHRRKDIWGDDADEFNPDHFSKENCSKRNPYAFMAFSNGLRICIGQRFAMISIKIILAKLFRQFRFGTDLSKNDIKFSLEITCKPVNVLVHVQQRQNSL